ncbi:hypothetical protein L210DRAFT_598436 [Boletus edulis BED1]|uniref:Uncharacterized protein n=1 Tax=Boletus edulis BED1 TaxID=1328754 RepID=A0AAD4BQI5_BOLED|nr:hypothetical protein L210DRAFT_598436 [Boletus edulis BED1]
MTRIKAVSGALIVGYLQSLCLLTYHAEVYTSTRRLSLSRMCRTGEAHGAGVLVTLTRPAV